MLCSFINVWREPPSFVSLCEPARSFSLLLYGHNLWEKEIVISIWIEFEIGGTCPRARCPAIARWRAKVIKNSADDQWGRWKSRGARLINPPRGPLLKELKKYGRSTSTLVYSVCVCKSDSSQGKPSWRVTSRVLHSLTRLVRQQPASQHQCCRV